MIYAPILDVEINVNCKTKPIEFNVYYKRAITNVVIQKKQNHQKIPNMESSKNSVTEQKL